MKRDCTQKFSPAKINYDKELAIVDCSKRIETPGHCYYGACRLRFLDILLINWCGAYYLT